MHAEPHCVVSVECPLCGCLCIASVPGEAGEYEQLLLVAEHLWDCGSVVELGLVPHGVASA